MSEEIELIAATRRSRIASRSDFAEKIASVWWLAIVRARRAVSRALAACARSVDADASAVSMAVRAEVSRAEAWSGLSWREASICAG